jgi:CBS domain-containing protein
MSTLAQFQRPLAVVDAGDTLEQAARAMRDRSVGCLLVTRASKPLGIITDRDLVIRGLAEGADPRTPVGDLATYGPVTLSVHDRIETAASCMRTHGIRRLPIVDDGGRAVGIVTADDLLVLLGRSLADVCEGIENPSESNESR